MRKLVLSGLIATMSAMHGIQSVRSDREERHDWPSPTPTDLTAYCTKLVTMHVYQSVADCVWILNNARGERLR